MSTEDLFLNGLRTQFEFEVNLGEISLVGTGIEKFTSGQFPLFRHHYSCYTLFSLPIHQITSTIVVHQSLITMIQFLLLLQVKYNSKALQV